LADNLASAMVFLSFFVAHWIAQAMAWAERFRQYGLAVAV